MTKPDLPTNLVWRWSRTAAPGGPATWGVALLGVGLLAAALLVASGCSDGTKGGGTDAVATGDGGKPAGKCGFDLNTEQIDRSAKLTVYSGAAVVKADETIQKDTAALKAGQNLDLAYDIKNAAAKDAALELLITKIVFTYSGPSGKDDGAFACVVKDVDGKEFPCSSADFKSVIPPGFEPACASKATTEAQRFFVRFTKVDNIARDCTVQVFADSGGTTQSLKFKIATKAGKPAIAVQPAEVNFGVVGIGGPPKTEKMSVLNTGDGNLQIKGVIWTTGDKRFAIDVAGQHLEGGKDMAFDPPLEVTPGSELPVVATFAPDDDKGHLAELEFQHNASLGNNKAILKGNFEVPCLLVTPAKKLDMGVIYVGSDFTKSVLLENCGAVDVEVSKTELVQDDQGVFALKSKAPTETDPIKIPKNGKAKVEIQCTPPSENKDAQGKQNPFTATLGLSDNTTIPQKVIDIQCYGTAASCPTPVILLPDGEQVEPQMPIHLDASPSFAKPGQTIWQYKWSVTKQPAGATNMAFYANDTSPVVTYGVKTNDPKTGKEVIWATVAGEYCFQLDVEDSSGTKSCEPASSCMLVVPTVAIHVELLWDTPADTNKTDTGDNAGTDLDLHFVHPKAYDGKLCTGAGSGPCQPDLDKDGQTDPWFNGVYDCFWYGTSPSWGNPADGADNPSLDLDDTDGWGPENLNVVTPEPSTLYGIGVNYWAANNFFPDDSTATVNVYVSGMLKGTFVQLLHQCDMWWVTQVQWASGDLVAFGGSNLPPPSTGKVTPAYWSNLAGTLNGPCKKK